VAVDRPDLNGREKILRVHTRTVTQAPGLDLATIAREDGRVRSAPISPIS